MILIMIFLLISIILEIIILGLIYSKIIINIENLEINAINTQINVDTMLISIEIKLYKVLKVLKVKFYIYYFQIFGIKIYYRKALKYESKTEFSQKIYKFIKKNNIQIKNIKPELEYFKFNLNFGTENAIITSVITATLSGIIVIILNKFVNNFNREDYSFKITPNYFNMNNFRMELKSKMNFDVMELIR